jgi:DNA-binding GntR family transcriptional regulator
MSFVDGADEDPRSGSNGVRRDIQRAPLGNQIAAALRRDIFLGRLRPGTRLAQHELCAEFGTSRMPVRDALRELLYDGTVMSDGARTVVVAPLSRSDLIDSFQIEGLLNGLAARLATPRASAEDFEILTSLHKQMLASNKAGKHEEMAQLNWQFHRHINRLAGSRKLLSALRVVSLDVPRDYLIRMPEWASKTNTEHAQIIAAMKARDPANAESLMEAHLTESGKGLADFLVREGLQLD